MQVPKPKDKLRIKIDDTIVEEICSECRPLGNSAYQLSIMTVTGYDRGDQCWLVSPDGVELGASVMSIGLPNIETNKRLVVLRTLIPKS